MHDASEVNAVIELVARASWPHIALVLFQYTLTLSNNFMWKIEGVKSIGHGNECHLLATPYIRKGFIF